MDEDIEQLDKIREKEEEAKKSFKSVINKKDLSEYEMDLLFFEEEEE